MAASAALVRRPMLRRAVVAAALPCRPACASAPRCPVPPPTPPFGILRRGFAAAAAAALRRKRILQSEVKDITFHFAVEEHLMMKAEITGPLLYLWRPAPVVTIGRHQNPWKECKLAQLEEDGVALVRRRSGGGCIFQDLGCSVFTFIAPSDTFNIDRNLNIVLNALKRCGVDAEKKGRNDLVCQDRKISGSAFRHAPDRRVSLHHGTLLVDTDRSALERYLTPDKRKLQAKGISSVGARVMNLREQFPTLEHDDLCKAMIAEFREVEGAQSAEVEIIDESSPICQEPDFRKLREHLESPEWRLGSTPDFSHQLETRIDGVGVLDIRLDVVAGRVSKAAIFSDALFPDVIDEVMKALPGAAYGRHGIKVALEPLRAQFTEEGPRLLLDSLTEWMLTEVDD